MRPGGETQQALNQRIVPKLLAAAPSVPFVDKPAAVETLTASWWQANDASVCSEAIAANGRTAEYSPSTPKPALYPTMNIIAKNRFPKH